MKKTISRREAIKQISGTLATVLLADGCTKDAETEVGRSDLIEGIEAEAKVYQPNPILFSDQKPVVSSSFPIRSRSYPLLRFLPREASETESTSR
jgi:hypothetical protein